MNPKTKNLLKPHYHIPQLFKALLEALMTPLLIYITLLGNVVMFLTAYLFYYFEKETNETVNNYGDALWWALCTVSTVGYGDIVPITGWGRIVGAFLIITGVVLFLGFIAVLVSVLPSFMGKEQKK